MRLLQQSQGIPQDLFDSITRQDGNGLIWSIMNNPINEPALNFGRGILRRFLHERTVIFPLRRIMSQGVNGTYSADVPKFLEMIETQRGAIEALQADPSIELGRAIGTDISEPSVIFKPIGIEFFDSALGGQRVGDCNGIIGTIGGGKTTTGVHMATAAARQSFFESMQTSARPELSIFITAEESGEKIRPRIESAAFQIPYAKLATMRDWGALTTRANLEPYEYELAARRTGTTEVLSELERYQLGRIWLRESLHLVDFSGSQASPHAGKGFVPELVASIENVLRRRQYPFLRSVFIDWAGILVKRHMDAIGAKEDSLRHFIAGFNSGVRRKVAEAFGCTVWVFHQIKGSLLNASPTKLFHHSDAAEANAFAAELAVCGCIGVPDRETGCRRLNWSKIRYKPREEVPPLTFKIHRRFSMIEDVSTQYGVDESGHRFSRVEDLARTQGLAAARPRAIAIRRQGTRQANPSQCVGNIANATEQTATG